MSASVAAVVSDALPRGDSAPASAADGARLDLRELQDELERVAADALAARRAGLDVPRALRSADYPALRAFHQDLRDALFVEIPDELRDWIDTLRDPERSPSDRLASSLTDMAAAPAHAPEERAGRGERGELQRALAELLVFEAVRLRLLVAACSSEEFERLGGDEDDLDAIAWEEVEAVLGDPRLHDGGVRPLHVMFAAASLALVRDAAERAGALRHSGGELREELAMRARLRAALRELRLAEAVLLENALSNLLGNERVELRDLQRGRPIALEGLSRQAMDQRVSRGRRALQSVPSTWPRRREPALFDLLRANDPHESEP